ncbi:alpha/beta hydrolase [Halococcoides cellulosivorans]|uniref:Alpha/beta hydrolase n=2 Tax=Halococcoides cellulosivorans TaxID=1679096 RepID=A0A2R4X4H6_9EURY|nr:alpha/beta hydrolase [Halococcoides cellulosivorans]
METLRETAAVRGRLLAWQRPRLIRAAEWLGARSRDGPAVGGVTDRTIAGRDGAIAVRSYRPPAGAPIALAGSSERGADDGGEADDPADGDRTNASAADDPPGTVVFFHGGGFVLGSITTYDRLCRQVCRATGWTVHSVGYRRAPENPFPAAVEDAIDATQWAADRAEGPLVVAGDSAGGNLAAVVAYWAATANGPDIDRQVLLYPGVDHATDHPSRRDHTGLMLTEAALEWFGEAYYGSDIVLQNPYADPMAACDLSGVAPATVLTAGFDPLRDGGLAYGDRLRADGVDLSRLHEPDQIHGFLTLPDIDRTAPVLDRLASEIRATREA